MIKSFNIPTPGPLKFLGGKTITIRILPKSVDEKLAAKINHFNETTLKARLAYLLDSLLGTRYRELSEAYASYIKTLEESVAFFQSEVEGGREHYNELKSGYEELIKTMTEAINFHEANADRWKALYYEKEEELKKKGSLKNDKSKPVQTSK